MTNVPRGDAARPLDPVQAGEPVSACPACGVVGPHGRYVLREMMFGLREPFDYLLCRACGTIRIATVPGDLGRHYPPQYHSGALDEEMRPDRAAIRRLMVRLRVAPMLFGHGHRGARLIRNRVPLPVGSKRWLPVIREWGLTSFDGRVLDVGCGPVPTRLVALRALGFTRLQGVEPFIDHDVTVEGVPVRRGTIRDVTGRCQAIMFHHSLEHVPDPEADLRAAARLIGDRGRVIVRTPVMGSALWERFGVNWWELDPPRHLFVFSRAGLVEMAARVGLELEGSIQETAHREFIGSAQYERDIATYGPGSWFVDPEASTITRADVEAFREAAALANMAGAAGRALYRFRLKRTSVPSGAASVQDAAFPAGKLDGPSRASHVAREVTTGQAAQPGSAEWAPFRDVSSPELVRIPGIEVDPARASAPRLTVLLPHLQLGRMTGGPNTIVNLVGRLVSHGIRIRLASVIGPTDSDEAALRAHMSHLCGAALPDEALELQAAGEGGGPLRLGPRDVLMATWWPTAHVARAALDRIDAREFVYMVQDFEPAFYGWSTNHALALQTYSFPVRAVVNESLLLDYLMAQGVGVFGRSDAGRLATAFEPAVDRGLFHPASRTSDRLRLLFYARLHNPRNCFELGLRAMRDAVASGAFDDGRWEFLAIGAPTPPLDLGRGMTLQPSPWRSYEDYAALLRNSDLLLSLMLSPHTSYPPLEAAACGATVITNEFGPKTARRMGTISSGIRAVELDAEALARAIAVAAQERAAGAVGDGMVNAPAAWEESFAEVVPWLARSVREVGAWE